MKLLVQKATTDVTVYLFIQNSSVTTGAGLTGLAYNSASLVAYYVRPLGSATAITLATQTVTGAHSDGGFVEVDATNMPGVYRLDLPDAVCATGVNSVVVMLKGATNMAPVLLEIQLSSFNPNDSVRLGLTALPNAAADAAGGLPISDAGGLDLDAQIGTKINDILTDTGTTLQGELDGIQADTEDIQTRLPAALVGGRIDASVGAMAANVVTASAVADGAIDRATFAADTGLQTVRSNTAQAGAATTITLDASASATSDFYNNCGIYLTGGTGAGQFRYIDGYDGATKIATVTNSWKTTPDNTTTFAIIPNGVIHANVKQITDNEDYATYFGTMVNQYGLFGYTNAAVTLMGNNVVTAASLAADAGTEIGTAVWAAATRTLTALDEDSTTLDIDAAVRAAIGLASANLDTQLDALPTAAENAAALMDLSNGVETGVTPRQALRFIAAALAGELSGAATTTVTIKAANNNGTTRITATVDADGNRTALTLNGS